jgi:hypothetical protein
MPASDLDLLPPDLAAASRSRREIVLPLADAERAVEHLAKLGRRIEAWEGWLELPGGGRTRSLAQPGSFALPMDVRRAADAAREGMRRAHEAWARRPEYPDATLYFGLTLATTDP